MNKKSKLIHSIKGKLISATCMLLVAMIMVVSSTYAWFTLSTAPEVTGIQTAVGANGALEIALLPASGLTDDITSEAGDSQLPWFGDKNKNVTWGNLVDLTEGYGLDKITLYPAALNVTDANTLGASILKTPAYGADGRVSVLDENTVTGIFNSGTGNFDQSDATGVRGVGVASGMTDRELDYRNAQSAANTATALAKTLASRSLNSNGSALANIAIKYGMNSTNATFGKTDVAALRAIINDLQGEGGVFEQLDTAYMQYILAYAASKATDEEGIAWNAVRGAVTADGATLNTVVAAIGDANLPTAVQTALAMLNGAKGAVATADTKLQTMEATLATDDDATFTWAQIREAMEPLADPAAMTINGFKASEVKEKLGELVSSVTAQGGLKVIMATGAGVYADIADQCGDYTASITIERVEYNGIVLNNMNARMETKTTVTPQYLPAIGSAVKAAGDPVVSDEAQEAKPITELYGYIIDLAFRTNASDSKLLLQTAPIDRIYADNSNDETMGHGASMTFKATTTDFSNDQVKSLMRAIRIVFFDPSNTNTILAYAKLDVDNAKLTTDGIQANIYLYTPAKSASVEYVEDANGTYKLVGEEYVEIGGETYDGTKYRKVENAATQDTFIKNQAKAVITPLEQSTAQTISTLVYLDGENMTNKDVAATAATSMTGTMNLQFSSSATLVPMNYTPLQNTVEATEATVAQGGNLTLAELTTGETYEFSGTAPAGWNITNNIVTASSTAAVDSSVTVVKKNSEGKITAKYVITVTSTTP